MVGRVFSLCCRFTNKKDKTFKNFLHQSFFYFVGLIFAAAKQKVLCLLDYQIARSEILEPNKTLQNIDNQKVIRGYGEIGRRTRLRIWRREAWGFESLYPYFFGYWRVDIRQLMNPKLGASLILPPNCVQFRTSAFLLYPIYCYHFLFLNF
jgi:hypothetical protein